MRLKSTEEGVSGTVSVSPRAALMAERRVRKVCWDASIVVEITGGGGGAGMAGSGVGAETDEDWCVGTGIGVGRAAS